MRTYINYWSVIARRCALLGDLWKNEEEANDTRKKEGTKKRDARGVTARLRFAAPKRRKAAILERKRESGVPLFCVPRQRRSSQPENVSNSNFRIFAGDVFT